MKGSVVILDHINGRAAAASMVDGVVQDFQVDPEDVSVPTPGTIYRAVVDRPLKGQGGVMLRLPEGATGFYRQAKGLRPGQTLLVQVTGFSEAGKAVPVTAKVLFKSRYAIITPDAPGLNISRSIRDDDRRDELLAIAHQEMQDSAYGLILRSVAEGGDEDEIGEDIASMRATAEGVMAQADGEGPALLCEGPNAHLQAWRDWPTPDQVITREGGFEDLGVMDALSDLFAGATRLPDGGHVYVEETRALVAVDVNTGGDFSTAAGLKANLATARVLPRLLRCRGLGGQITIDFAPLAKNDRRQVETALRAAFKTDSVDTALVGWTPLGHYELQRKRERLPLTARDIA